MPAIRVCVLLLLIAGRAAAQPDSNEIKKILRSHINILAAPNMHGRGYVNEGVELAAEYIEQQFRRYRLERISGMRSYRQSYHFSVNTFPGRADVALNGKKLVPGRDYLVDAGSPPFKCSKMRVAQKDISTYATVEEWKKAAADLDKKTIYLLQNADSFCKVAGIRASLLYTVLPQGCFIVPVKTKQSWTVAQDLADATIIYVYDSVLPANVTTADMNIESKVVPKYENFNIIGKVPGELKDSIIVFSAHYDHLGRMGDAVFPGASDNASGVAMLLYLAEYFAAHPQKFTMVFIAFSGEEAGLLGSAYFTEHPPFALRKIRMLLNVDIMGDATGGATVVNATVFPWQFSKLTAINEEHRYLPEIKTRGKAANSDHYHFSEKGVPAFFMYTIGGKGYYHDIYDRAEEISLNNMAGVARLLTDFAIQLQQ
ncbi:hypothetical protein GCM10023093_09120 [Nemorincola caseinilytica]|uniref:Peptidase M28 domain-containing protein n=1 Tax=Nemorincola caseinilytica TaxID=2054315 RepID=A0ABP8NAR7_9BACT